MNKEPSRGTLLASDGAQGWTRVKEVTSTVTRSGIFSIFSLSYSRKFESGEAALRDLFKIFSSRKRPNN